MFGATIGAGEEMVFAPERNGVNRRRTLTPGHIVVSL